jgi:hypothetical protein
MNEEVQSPKTARPRSPLLSHHHSSNQQTKQQGKEEFHQPRQEWHHNNAQAHKSEDKDGKESKQSCDSNGLSSNKDKTDSP